MISIIVSISILLCLYTRKVDYGTYLHIGFEDGGGYLRVHCQGVASVVNRQNIVVSTTKHLMCMQRNDKRRQLSIE